MSYIETPARQRYPWYVRLLFWLQRRHYGRELEPTRFWARMPRAFLAMAMMYGALNRKSSPVDETLRALIQVRVSQINWCEFCVDLNSSIAIERGAAHDKLAALPAFSDSLLFTEREKAALAFAEAMTAGDRRPHATDVVRLKQHFDDDAIIELTALIAYQNMSSKFNAALGIPAQGFCRTTRST